MATNILQNVATYQAAELALLQNSYAYITLANTKFKDFNKIQDNLGATVTFDLPPRYSSVPSLVFGSFQDSEQRVQSLTADQQRAVAYEFSNLEQILNVEDYMTRFGRSAVAEIGTNVETNIAENNISHTFRAFGDGITDITSYKQLAQSVANYENFGSPKTGKICGIIPDVKYPEIVDNGLNQFTVERGNRTAMSWEIGTFSGVTWYKSNLLPLHVAGSVGQAQLIMTVVSINAAGTQLTMSTTGLSNPDANAIKEGDILTFQDGVSGQPDMRFLTFIGHVPSSQSVQVRATADAGSDGAGQVIVNISPALVSTALDKNQNINNPVAAGMELKALPNHVAGLLFADQALFLAMPRLPSTMPFPSANQSDPESGVSMRLYYGHQFGSASTGWVHDCFWGSTLVDEYAMRLVFKV